MILTRLCVIRQMSTHIRGGNASASKRVQVPKTIISPLNTVTQRLQFRICSLKYELAFRHPLQDPRDPTFRAIRLPVAPLLKEVVISALNQRGMTRKLLPEWGYVEMNA